ncbi:hypothetical protein KI387_010960, partial [Taxus chinensis]
MGTNSPDAKGHLGREDAIQPDRVNQKNLSHEALGHLGQMDANRPVQPENRESSALGQIRDKGMRGTRIAEGAESQSDCATRHQRIWDREAHFG